MKMKKYISFAFMALVSLVVVSCNKKADVDAIEPKLPSLQLSSLGYQQTGPFIITGTTPTTLSINFGATATKTPVGAFKLEILNGTAATSPILKTINFPTWSGKDDTSIGSVTNHTISYVSEDTSYPNTIVYGGTINLKLSALAQVLTGTVVTTPGLVSGGTYSVRATAYSADGAKTSQLVQLSFFKIQ